MNFNNFTIKAQEAVQEAVNLTQARGATSHRARTLASERDEGRWKCHQLHLPKVGHERATNRARTGQADRLTAESIGGEPYLSRETNEVFQKATQYSKEMGDEFVSLEPILQALLNVKSTASTILKDAGMTEKELRNAINELRKGEKVLRNPAKIRISH